MRLRQEIENPADHPVLGRDPVAVDKDDRLARALFDIVDAHPVDVQEGA